MSATNNTTTIDNFQFLDTVFGGYDNAVETPVVCAFKEAPEVREASGRGWPAYTPESGAINWLIGKRAHLNNTYYCISTVAIPEEDEKLNRQHKSLTGTWVFPLDDIGTGKGAKYTPDTVPLPPSAVIETSKDNFQYLYFPDEPVRDVAMAQALLTCMVADHGDSGASIAAKYVRLPVGHNNKASRCTADGQPFEVKLTRWHPERRYTVQELTEAFHVEPEELERQRARLDRRRLRLLSGRTPENDDVYEWLKEAGYVEAEPDNRGFATLTCPWHHLHTTGSDTAGYSPLGHGDEFSPLRQFKCLHGHCDDHGIAEFLEWVVEQGGPDLTGKSLTHYIERYVYIQAGPAVFDRQTRNRLTLKEFHDSHANAFYYGGQKGTTKILLSKEWQASTERRTVYNTQFKPCDDEIITDRGSNFLNTFRPVPRGEETTDIDKVFPILKHIAYLFPEKEDYERMLDFMAATVCRPQERLSYALLHVSSHHGTGRGWVKQLMTRLLGSFEYHTSANVDGLVAGTGFNEYLYESLLVTFDEVFETGKGRYRVMDKLREMITEPRVMVNIKHGFKGEMSVYANVMLLSNHRNAISLTEADRRIWTVMHDADPREPEYYEKLWPMLDDAEALNQLFWMLDRRAPGVKIGEHAPKNAARALLIEEGLDEFSAVVKDVINKLRGKGVMAIWATQLERVMKAEGLELPLERQTHQHHRLRAELRDHHVGSAGRKRMPLHQRDRLKLASDKQSVYTLVPLTQEAVRDAAIETGDRTDLSTEERPLKLV